jgi:two-component system sensor kinase FixL
MEPATSTKQKQRPASVIEPAGAWGDECLQAIVNATPEWVKLVAPNGTLLRINPAGMQTLGSGDAKSLIGRSMVDLVVPEDRSAWQHFHDRICRGHISTLEFGIIGESGQRRQIESHGVPVPLPDGSIAHLGVTRDVTERKQSEEAASNRARQQEALATLGQTALASDDLGRLFDEVVRTLAQTMGVQYVTVWEVQPDGLHLRLTAGTGWRPESIGHTTIGMGSESPAGFALAAGEPIMIEDLRTDPRFTAPPFLIEHTVVSGLTVPIAGQPAPYGALSAYCAQPRRFSTDDVLFIRSVANVLGAAIRNDQADRALRDTASRLRAVVDTAVEGIITIDQRGSIESINPAGCRLFGYYSTEVIGRNVKMLMPEPYQSQHDEYLGAYMRTGRAKIIGIGREVVGLRKDGATFPLDLSVSEFQVAGQRMFTGIVRDITERRRLEREILEAGAQEQRRIGQDLHDGLCQQLTGVAFALEVLGQKLVARAAPETAGIRKTAELVDQAITQAREMARGLQPVTLEASGLVAALQELAAKVEQMFRVSCLFVSDGPVLVHDNLVATHLYRIAQEAISNAVKHGKAKTIMIDLSADRRELGMTITDDGVGLGQASSDGKGIGLQTMQYRARLIGGALEVRPGKSGGTSVICRVLLGAQEPKKLTNSQKVPPYAKKRPQQKNAPNRPAARKR